MGLLDKLRRQAKSTVANVDDLAEKHEDRIDDAIDKAAEMAKKKTGDQHDSKVDQAAAKAHDLVDKLAKPEQ